MPYREAKVCHLFRDVLHGWGRILLSVNVSPCAADYDETSRVLQARCTAHTEMQLPAQDALRISLCGSAVECSITQSSARLLPDLLLTDTITRS